MIGISVSKRRCAALTLKKGFKVGTFNSSRGSLVAPSGAVLPGRRTLTLAGRMLADSSRNAQKLSEDYRKRETSKAGKKTHNPKS